MATNKEDVSKTLEDLNPFEFYEYATFIEGRTSGSYMAGTFQYKRHRTLGQAKAAVTSAHSVAVKDAEGRYVGTRRAETHIYRWSDKNNKWLEVFI